MTLVYIIGLGHPTLYIKSLKNIGSMNDIQPIFWSLKGINAVANEYVKQNLFLAAKVLAQKRIQ